MTLIEQIDGISRGEGGRTKPLTDVLADVATEIARLEADNARLRSAGRLPTAAQIGKAMYEASGLHVTPFEELHERQRAYYTVCGAAVLKLIIEARK